MHSVIIAPVGEHSEKPDEAWRRVERLYGGPYLELFARRARPGWTTWGNELPPPIDDAPYDPADDLAKSVAVGLERERVVAGGEPWVPRDPDDLEIPPFLRRRSP